MRMLILMLVALLLPLSVAGAGETVSVLTLNVAGLPDNLTRQDTPSARMRGIAERAKDYDVVLYQEDFYYSKHLDRGDFSHTFRGEKWHAWAFFWPWLRKSGLTIKTSLPAVSPRFWAYSECDGHFKNASDCWVPKGVLCIRTLTPGGVMMDVCNTHMDAGNSKQAVKVRRSQFQEFSRFVPALPPPDVATPWVRIEGGDFNEKPHESNIAPVLAERDIVALNRVNNHVVDYIMVTHSPTMTAHVVQAGFVTAFDGLSDHPAVEIVLDLDY